MDMLVRHNGLGSEWSATLPLSGYGRVARHPLTILRAPPNDFFEAQLFEMQSTVWQWREGRRQGSRQIPMRAADGMGASYV